LIVAIGHNPEKQSLLPINERAEIIRRVVAGLELANVSVDVFEGLTVDFVKKSSAAAIIRGVRNSSDLLFEFQVALTNRVVAGVETVFIMTSPQYSFTSSSLIRQVATMGGDISQLVPPEVLGHVRKAAAMKNPADHGLHETE
ncbi:MAG TPA: pantetheine-phosphate adenylyltransferase, partial [Phycisphaerae bacterium]|nr:pantetheine-phosphate adenylyltransferase [Phycisphaerae bacterium]